jgi:hypothetical protein
VSVSAQAPLASDPGTPPEPGSGDGSGRPPAARSARPLVVTGGIAACAAAGSGLAVLITLTAIGWITAPHVGLGSGLGGVLRTAANLWLVAHHVGFTVRGAGRIGLLPLGLVLLPGALLVLAGRWVVRAGSVTQLRHVGYAAIALALPYALLAGALALAARTPAAVPSLTEAVVAAFLLALVAGGLGAARALAPWSRLAALMPARPRSIIMGMLGAVALLTAAGAALAGGSLAVHLPEVRAASDALGSGAGGAMLLLLAQLAYLPNAIIWAVAYALGPGFAFGTGTVVSPTGSSLGAVPDFPMLAALPAGGHPGGPALLPVVVLAVPYLAGIFAGVITVRISPTPALEAAPLWGFAAGAAAGVLSGVAAAFSGGPLGDGRLSAVGPSGFAVGLVAVLEIGVTAALAAAATNWFILHRATRRRRAASQTPPAAGAGNTAGTDPDGYDAGLAGYDANAGQDHDDPGYDETGYDETGYRDIAFNDADLADADLHGPAHDDPDYDDPDRDDPDRDDPDRDDRYTPTHGFAPAQASGPQASGPRASGPQASGPRASGPRASGALSRGRLPRGIVDESDDAGGHRIFFNPWAAHDDSGDAEDDEYPGYEDSDAADPDDPSAPDGTLRW